MTRKLLLAAALGLPLVALTGTAFAGPTSSYPPARVSTVVNGPYAQFTPMVHPDGYECRYQGGPKGPVWHQRRID